MNKVITTTARKTFTALTVAAIMGVMGGVKTAKALDQQATEAQMDNEINHRAAAGYGYLLSGAYAKTT